MRGASIDARAENYEGKGIVAMPQPSHLSLTGRTQGLISQGCCTMQGSEDTILVEAVDHLIEIPRDPQTGLPTGKRVHQPLKLTKLYDKGSPKLYQALVTGERLDDVTVKFYRIAPTGKEEHYFTIKLSNAILVDIRNWVPNCLDKTFEQYQHMEDISFTYQAIEWTWEPDGVMSMDDWTKPVS